MLVESIAGRTELSEQELEFLAAAFRRILHEHKGDAGRTGTATSLAAGADEEKPARAPNETGDVTPRQSALANRDFFRGLLSGFVVGITAASIAFIWTLLLVITLGQRGLHG